ncbi:metalloregulator ArsR/SmtB family transcription factor [Thioalkalivibrio thiocyanodenitrificans]|uniref:metalloregulator ArsR/SmtB family transcription factor n=1 Tax=Thioalkalivibrio thiocyanodenitrificans TaxID=243063 RepID=UPI0018DE139D|nr:metalloregulator ArsR/SmtB family transcription factor [Thioalkalivibrio thiocyanodenitrificans]
MNMIPEAVFRALSDGTRLRCLALLLGEGELCVYELTHALGVPQPKVSRHLAQLRDSGLVNDKRRGQWVYYRISGALPDWVRSVLSASLEAVSGDSPYTEDRKRLAGMEDRPGAHRTARGQ